MIKSILRKIYFKIFYHHYHDLFARQRVEIIARGDNRIKQLLKNFFFFCGNFRFTEKKYVESRDLCWLK